jgi:peptidoglycan/xylan/chitin deacetylase (PgdA/CDA1 family)
MEKLFLLRYDTEGTGVEKNAGFFETAVAVHSRHNIPVTFFCRGATIDAREEQFRWLAPEIKGNPLFDVQDHSYSHLGIPYERGQDLPAVRADYERSFAAHERIFGQRPIGVSLCGNTPESGEGNRLAGFDVTEKSRAEFQILADLGVRMVDTLLVGRDGSREFINYAALGHPEIMGFPSDFSDTSWLHARTFGDPLAYISGLIEERAARGQHLALILHDWCSWQFGLDHELGHVPLVAAKARACGYRLVTHLECLHNPSLWR